MSKSWKDSAGRRLDINSKEWIQKGPFRKVEMTNELLRILSPFLYSRTLPCSLNRGLRQLIIKWEFNGFRINVFWKFCSHGFSRLENTDMSASSIEKCFIDNKMGKILMSARRCQLELVKICLQYDIHFYIHRNIQHRCQARHRQERRNMQKEKHFYVNNGWIFHEVLMCHKQKDY